MWVSKYNIIAKLNRPVSRFSHIIVNTLTGSIDALDKPSLITIEAVQAGSAHDQEQELIVQALKYRGYLYENKWDEEKKVQVTVRAMQESGFLGKYPVFIVLTSYNCNLSCPYCFQRKTKATSAVITSAQIERVFQSIAVLARGYEKQNVTVDVMGGEPLLPGIRYESAIKEILARASESGFRVRITSNGTGLKQYVNILANDVVQGVQVTVDGPPHVQDVRRASRNQQRTTDAVVVGIQEAVQRGINVSARTNVDSANMDELPALASFYEDRGWLAQSNFFAYLSPVHDHSCIGECHVDGELELFEKYLKIIDESPIVERVFRANNFAAHRWLGSALRDAESPVPRMYRCEGNVNQFVFDAEGKVYPCLESAGSKEHSVGVYEPALVLQEAKLAKWRRKVTDIPKCKECVVRFACAGGCLWHAVSQPGGDMRSVACEPTEEEIRLYLERRGHELLEGALKGGVAQTAKKLQ